jgi:hypothetical protein
MVADKPGSESESMLITKPGGCSPCGPETRDVSLLTLRPGCQPDCHDHGTE